MIWFLIMLAGNVLWAKLILGLGFDFTSWTGATLLGVPALLWGWIIRDIEMICKGDRS